MSSIRAPRILKAESARDLHASVEFNFDDIRQKCDEFIRSTQERATQILSTAQTESVTIREQARLDGLADARKTAFQDADAEINRRSEERAQQLVNERLQTALPAVQAAVDEMDRELDQTVQHWERTAVGLSIAIAEKLIHRELTASPRLVLENISAALKLASGQKAVRVHLNPTDAETLKDFVQDILDRSSLSDATVVLDADLARGGCLVKSRNGSIDGRMETQLARLIEELGVDTSMHEPDVSAGAAAKTALDTETETKP
ncbi:MAG: FliH/SctL family protein [Planctomycetota bacterium]|nr:FliH/SctL family protein [Planctomycetota bacterium]